MMTREQSEWILNICKACILTLRKRILPYVEEECDRMEYENSMVYDQYPDKLQLKMMSRRVYDNVRKHERIFDEEEMIEEQTNGTAEQTAGISGAARRRDRRGSNGNDMLSLRISLR